jgi:hypothetical protein
MTKIVSGVVGMIGVFWLFIAGGAAVWWYDRRPPDVPKPVVARLWIFSHTFALAPSLRAQLDASQATYRQAMTLAAEHNRIVGAATASLNAKVNVAEAAAQKAIHDRNTVLNKEIPRVLTPAVDLAFALPVGFVRIHDAAAADVELSSVPLPAGLSDGSASPVEISRAAAVIADNYAECHLDAERLTQLQDWAAAVVKITAISPK